MAKLVTARLALACAQPNSDAAAPAETPDAPRIRLSPRAHRSGTPVLRRRRPARARSSFVRSLSAAATAGRGRIRACGCAETGRSLFRSGSAAPVSWQVPIITDHAASRRRSTSAGRGTRLGGFGLDASSRLDDRSLAGTHPRRTRHPPADSPRFDLDFRPRTFWRSLSQVAVSAARSKCLTDLRLPPSRPLPA